MSKDKIEILIAGPEDNQGLIDLSHNCPMESDISVYPDRSPDYSAIQKLINKNSYHVIAKKNNNIIGCLGCTYFDVQINNEIFRSGVMVDFKVDPSMRKSLITYRIAKFLAEKEKISKTDLWIGMILAQNKAPLPFIKGRVGFPKANFFGRFNVRNFIPILKFKIDHRFEICQATQKDIPEIVKLYKNFYNKHQLTPYFTEEKFLELITNFKGLEIENFSIAKENGKIKAVLATWDQSFYKKMFVRNFHASAKVLLFFCKFLSIFMKIPKLPKSNNHLKVMNIIMYAHNNCPEAFKALIRHTNNKMRGGEYPILTLYMSAKSPLNKYLKAMPGTTVGTDCYIATENEEINKTLENRMDSIHLEWQIFV
ncbi:hypothetical protein ACFLTI_07935 [Bacteroidota bacterium]